MVTRKRTQSYKEEIPMNERKELDGRGGEEESGHGDQVQGRATGEGWE